MKKVKNLFKLLTLLICVFVGVNYASAKEYSEYKVGQEIEVRINDEETRKFYVLNKSSKSDCTLNAISKDVVGEAMAYADIDKYIEETLADSWVKIGLENISIPKIQTILGDDVELEEDLVVNDPEWAVANEDYWTITGDAEKKWVIEKGNITGSANPVAVTEKRYIRPVITVSKEIIIGGTNLSKEEYAWSNFSTLIKNEVNSFYEDSEDEKVEIISDDSSMKIKFTDSESTYETNFTYEKGIMSYVKPATITDKILKDSFWIEQMIDIFAEYKNYDKKEVDIMLESTKESDLTLKDYGIVLKSEKKENKEEDKTETYKYYTSFKLDLVNGFPQIEKKTNSSTEKNPNTGSFNIAGIFVLIMLICGLTYIVIRKKSLFPKHN